MNQFIESVRERQIDNDTPCVRAVIEGLSNSAGGGDMHRPIVLQMEFGNRNEFLYIVRMLKERRRAGRIRVEVSPRDISRLLEDPQPDSAFYVTGDVIPHQLQSRIVEKYSDDVQKHLTPPIFVVVTHLHPDRLRAQGVWRNDFRELFGDRVVTLPTASERKPPELVEAFKAAAQRAATRLDKKKFKIEAGALDLLTSKWAMSPPPSLDFIIAAANRSVALADDRLKQIVSEAAARVERKKKLTITGKDVINAIMPDSPLADPHIEQHRPH